MRRAHDPARLRRRGDGTAATRSNRPVTPEPRAASVSLRLATRSNCLRLAPDFQHHAAERIAGQRIGGGAQCGLDIGRAHGHHQARIEPEFAPAAHRQRAGFQFGKILPHPQQRPPVRHAVRQAGDEAGRRRALPALGRTPHAARPAPARPAAPRRRRHGRATRDPARRYPACVSMRSMLPRRCASVFMRAPVMRRSSEMMVGKSRVLDEPMAGSIVHDMF